MAPQVSLKRCPPSGEGVHRWIYYAACTLTDEDIASEQAEEIIEEMMSRAPNPASEIEDALRSARGERKAGPRWSLPDPQRIAEIAKQGPTLLEVVSHSPEPIRFGEPRKTEAFIDTLFPGDPWLCVGRPDSDFYTARREFWRGRLNDAP